jgi:hypothetical protein
VTGLPDAVQAAQGPLDGQHTGGAVQVGNRHLDPQRAGQPGVDPGGRRADDRGRRRTFGLVRQIGRRIGVELPAAAFGAEIVSLPADGARGGRTGWLDLHAAHRIGHRDRRRLRGELGRVGVKLFDTGLRAEIVRRAVYLACSGGLRLIDFHAAHRVSYHTMYHFLAGARLSDGQDVPAPAGLAGRVWPVLWSARSRIPSQER